MFLLFLWAIIGEALECLLADPYSSRDISDRWFCNWRRLSNDTFGSSKKSGSGAVGSQKKIPRRHLPLRL